jgi:farnesyl-diphosphate farnesyltransferase
MLTRLFALTHGAGEPVVQERRLRLAPVVGEALQLTNILLDWPTDVRRGRCYLPARWLGDVGLTPAELVGRDRAEVRALAARLDAMARAAIAQVPDYLDLLPPGAIRYRLFCLWPAQWALASLQHARRDPGFPWGPSRPRMPRSRLWSTMVASLAIVVDPGAGRRLLRDRPAPALEAHLGLGDQQPATSAGRAGGAGDVVR